MHTIYNACKCEPDVLYNAKKIKKRKIHIVNVRQIVCNYLFMLVAITFFFSTTSSMTPSIAF